MNLCLSGVTNWFRKKWLANQSFGQRQAWFDLITNIYIYYPSDRRKKSFSSFFIFFQSVEPTTKTPPAPTKKDATPVPKPGSPVPKAPTVAPKAALEVKSSSPAPPKKSSSPVPPKKCNSQVWNRNARSCYAPSSEQKTRFSFNFSIQFLAF